MARGNEDRPVAPRSDDDDGPLVVLKLTGDALDAGTRDVIFSGAGGAEPVTVEVPPGEIDADALLKVTEWALDAGVELRIRGRDR